MNDPMPVDERLAGLDVWQFRAIQRAVHHKRLDAATSENERYTNWWVAVTLEALHEAGFRLVPSSSDEPGGAS